MEGCHRSSITRPEGSGGIGYLVEAEGVEERDEVPDDVEGGVGAGVGRRGAGETSRAEQQEEPQLQPCGRTYTVGGARQDADGTGDLAAPGGAGGDHRHHPLHRLPLTSQAASSRAACRM
ncbi:hypothetical protein ZWY2020_006375 [Hordeum vulgare]|nr:hypothetical protein ZWY2020_006375 [Hordeum vulgare]